MPLIEIIEAPAPVLDAAAPARFAVERPATGEHFEGTDFDLVGWVLGPGAARLEILQDGEVIRAVPVNLPRPDVRATYPDAASSCGFSTAISLEDWKENHFDLRAIFSDGPIALGSIRARRIWREDVRPTDSPFVSVVIAGSEGRPSTLAALESVLAQDYPNFEIVVVGDVEPEGAPGLAGRSPAVREVRADAPGLAAAWNSGIRRTVGDCLLFLTPGQLVTRNAIASALEAFRDHPESGVVLGRPQASGDRPPDPEGEFALFRRSIFESVGVFSAGERPKAEILEKIADRFPYHYLDGAAGPR